ncbi:Uncharacterised protein [Serratia fonticola]|nr:Uncharacterised protein [Serratia fonticola]
MSMTTKIEAIWLDERKKNSKRLLESNEFCLTRVNADSRFDIYGGLDSSSYVILAIGIAKCPPNLATDSSSLDYFRHQRHDGSWLMVLRLRQEGLETVFGRLCQDLIDATEDVPNEKALISLFRERLDLWKRLFQKYATGLLELHEIKGLLGELIILEKLLTNPNSNNDANEIITAWVGPLGADQDFIFYNQAVEVKAIRQNSESISIASLTQLDNSIPLTLVTVVLIPSSIENKESIGLNNLVAKIESMIAISSSVLDLFHSRLLEAGYVENEFYDSVLFILDEITFFNVAKDFPRLTPAMVPLGIISSNYKIALDAIENFIVPGQNYGQS